MPTDISREPAIIAAPGRVCLILLLVLAAAAPSQAQQPPPLEPFTVDYHFLRNSIHLADMKRRLIRHEDGRYEFTSRSVPVGLLAVFVDDTITETTTWTFHDGRPRPLKYFYLHKRKKPRHTELEFDWQDGYARGIAKNRPAEKALPDGAQDKMLYQLTMMLDLAAGKRELHYPVIGEGMTKEYVLKVVGEETIDTPLGRLATLRVHLDDKRRTTIWCAKKFSYLPVVIRQTEKDGAHMTMKATGVIGLPWQRASSGAADRQQGD